MNGIMAQVASNLKTAVDVTDLAFRIGSITKTRLLSVEECKLSVSLQLLLVVLYVAVDRPFGTKNLIVVTV